MFTPDTTPGLRATRREWIALAVLALPSLLVSIDLFGLLLALPALTEDLAPSSVEQLWIVDAYGFLLSGFLITMGALGDRLGRRRLLLVGAAAFGVASVLAAYAANPVMLIGARALLGVAGAALGPTTLAIITAMFRDPRQRSTAIGVWLACLMGGTAIGPLVGGAILAYFWWGAVFLLAVPAMVLLLLLGPMLLPRDHAPNRHARIDATSVALSLVAMLSMVYGVKELARHGWEPLPGIALVAGLAVAMVFLRRQRRLADPLLDLRLFGDPRFRTALGGMLVNTILPGATMVLIMQYLQLVGGLSPLRAGLATIPAAVAGILSAQIAPVLGRRVRPWMLICSGMMVSVAGLLLLTQAGTDAVATVITGLALVNAGTGPLLTLGTGIVVGAVPPQKAGSAAAISQTSNEFGFALGVALMGSLAAVVYRIGVVVPSGMPADAASAARESLAGAVAAAGDLPGPVADSLLGSAREAFTTGLHLVAAISAVVVAVMAARSMVAFRSLPPVSAEPEREQQVLTAASDRQADGSEP